ncbi:MAG: hypothetical protein GKC04_08935 [Methanomicrobiales archaeon]|nr:hypothetical protein [Methanomicrobiales archaeon]
MNRKFRIDAERLKRFDFEPVRDIKARGKASPDLQRRLEEDLAGTLEEEGIVIDDAFLQRVSDQWHARITADTRSVMDGLPDSRKPYYRMIRRGEPLKVRATIDRESGAVTTAPREGEP